MLVVSNIMLDTYVNKDYRSFLKDALSLKNKHYMDRADLATRLNCQVSFISQVCTLRAHLSLEHAFLVSEFLKFSSDEQELFLLMVQREKAGSVKLETFFDSKIKDLINSYEVIKNRINVQTEINDVDQSLYYSNWWHAAIHIVSSLPHINHPNDFAKYLGLDLEKVKSSLSFLSERGLVEKVNNDFQIGQARIHLGTKSPHLMSHHRNWRVHTLKKIDQVTSEDFNFTGVIGISKADGEKIKKMLYELLENIELVLKDSEEEEVYIFNADFYELKSR